MSKVNNLHTIIVPGVGDSDANHWQSWLAYKLGDSSRVVQEDWHKPVLNHWVQRFYQHVSQFQRPIQLVAHSFGCLTTIAALNQYPQLKQWVEQVILVAPANPARFSTTGFADVVNSNNSSTDDAHTTDGYTTDSYATDFLKYTLDLPTLLILSENDPWLAFEDAITFAKAWDVPYINQGLAGHINVESGYGAWWQLLDYLQVMQQQPFLFKKNTVLQRRFSLAG